MTCIVGLVHGGQIYFDTPSPSCDTSSSDSSSSYDSSCSTDSSSSSGGGFGGRARTSVSSWVTRTPSVTHVVVLSPPPTTTALHHGPAPMVVMQGRDVPWVPIFLALVLLGVLVWFL